MRASTFAAPAAALLASCGSAPAAYPAAVSGDAVLDAFDTQVLAATSAQAPTFAEVEAPRDETPRRFRAWLGWTAVRCEPCPADQTATCEPRCEPGKPFVCVRPSRMIACTEEETVSTRVSNGDDSVPTTPGPYVLEGAWSPSAPSAPPVAAEFAVTRVEPLQLPGAAP
jgi:hypothetical protein